MLKSYTVITKTDDCDMSCLLAPLQNEWQRLFCLLKWGATNMGENQCLKYTTRAVMSSTTWKEFENTDKIDT